MIHPTQNSVNPRLAREVAKFIRQSLMTAMHEQLENSDEELSTLLVDRAASSIAPSLLSSIHPGGKKVQQEAKNLYKKCLYAYRRKIRGGEPVDDMGAALAFFIAVNYEALYCEPVPAESLFNIERQMKHMFNLSPAWSTSNARDKQELFEQLAILSVLVAEANSQAIRQGTAAIANVKNAARNYLQQLLGIDPKSLVVTPKGLSIQPSVSVCVIIWWRTTWGFSCSILILLGK